MIRSFLYDTLFCNLTSRWYAEVLSRLPEGVSLLDVGVGTAGALEANAARIRGKRLHVTGIDIDADYVERAQQRIEQSALSENVDIRLESVYDHRGGPYDAVYFSASFMLLPDPRRALQHCATLLKPDGRIYFTQTFEKRRSRWLETVKPMLKGVTSIDFGRVTYEEDFRAEIRGAGLELEEFSTIAEQGGRAFCLAVARPVEATADVERPVSRSMSSAGDDPS
jgi:SAM-dependent methyltransferase